MGENLLGQSGSHRDGFKREVYDSQAGIEFLKKNPAYVSSKDLLQFPDFRKFVKGETSSVGSFANSAGPDENETATPEEIIGKQFHFLQDTFSQEVLERVMQQTPQFFERLVVDLLVKMGYGDGKITGRSGDGGIDGIIDEDKLGLDVIHIQAKKWQKGNNVGRKELQSFVGALAGQSGKKGVFITTSDFTKEALDYNPSNVKIAKINGHRLAQLMIQYNVGVTANVIYELKKIDSDYFEE